MLKKLITKEDVIKGISVRSETGKLRRVLLHRPNGELLNLVPDYLPEMLFDDIPWLEKAQEEHDAFAQILKDNGVEVVYLDQLTEQALTFGNAKQEFIEQFVNEAHIYTESARTSLVSYLSERSVKEVVSAAMSGIRKSQFTPYRRHLSDYLVSDYPFIAAPMPNLYFTRDPFACIGSGVALCRMSTDQRRRETIFGQYILRYHPLYSSTPLYYDRSNAYSIEGGDILVLNDSTVAVGISQRSQVDGVEKLAKNLFERNSGFTKVLAIDIPKTRSFMHLDTVFTMLDEDKFTVHPAISQQLNSFVLTWVEGKIAIKEQQGSLEDILQGVLNKDKITLIKCGGSNSIDAAREQWNDGANTLAINKGEVIVYARNNVTNQLLRDHGIITHEIPCSELSRGRGGPRCMSMPLIRE